MLTMRHPEFQEELHSNVVHAVQVEFRVRQTLSKAKHEATTRGIACWTASRTVSPIILVRLAANRSESRTLATLRDTLLPKLLSGELSVRNLPALSNVDRMDVVESLAGE